MSLQLHSSVLFTTDVKRLTNFYTTVLGQTVQNDFGACVMLHCGLSLWQMSDNLPLAEKLGYCCHSSGNKNLELCFETETWDDDVRHIKASGVELLHDVAEEPWGQMTVRFFDPDGNLVELGESIPTFVRRLHAAGNSPQAIAERTGVPLDTVLAYLNEQA